MPGTEDLGVNEIDQTSLRVGSLVPLSVSVRDVDGDGRPDLVVEFDAIQLTSRANQDKIRVSGWLKNSQVLVGDAELRGQRVARSTIPAAAESAGQPASSGEGRSGLVQALTSRTTTAAGLVPSLNALNFGYQLVGTKPRSARFHSDLQFQSASHRAGQQHRHQSDISLLLCRGERAHARPGLKSLRKRIPST